jgi:hypothetical protein
MPMLKNTTPNPIVLISGHTIEPGKTLKISDATVRANGPWLEGQMRRGNIVEETPRPAKAKKVDATPADAEGGE